MRTRLLLALLLTVTTTVTACGSRFDVVGFKVGADVPADIPQRSAILNALESGIRQLGGMFDETSTEQIVHIRVGDCPADKLERVNALAPETIVLCPLAFGDSRFVKIVWAVKHGLGHAMGLREHTSCEAGGVTSEDMSCWAPENGVPYKAVDLDAICGATRCGR